MTQLEFFIEQLKCDTQSKKYFFNKLTKRITQSELMRHEIELNFKTCRKTHA